MDKSLIPKIVDPNPPGGYLHLAYGITDERHKKLSEKMDDMDKNKEAVLHTMAGRISQIADIAETQEEFVYCLVADVMFLMKSRRHTIL